jgi:hypothetical protein
MAGEAALALSARKVVDECDAAAAGKLGRHFVPQDRSRIGPPDLLHVAPTEPAGQDTDDLAGALRLGHVREAGLALLV